MKFLLSFLLIILSTISFSAKLTMDVGGTYKFHGTYQVDEKNLFMTYQNFWTMTTNTPHVFKGNCSGTIKFNSGNQVNDIMCYGKNGDNYWYAAFNELAKGEMGASTSGFTIVAAKGPFEELIGQKCMGAYIELEDQHYIWKGVCNIPDKTFERILNYIPNKN